MLVDITDRKRAEDTLRESEERFRAIVETTPECVKLVAADGTLLLMNEAGLTMVGAAAPDEVTGRSVYDLIAPEDREIFRRFNQRVCAGEKGSLEFDIDGLQGKRRHMETHAVPLAAWTAPLSSSGLRATLPSGGKPKICGFCLAPLSIPRMTQLSVRTCAGKSRAGTREPSGFMAIQLRTRSEADFLVVPGDRHDEEKEILDRLQRGERVDHLETVRRRKDGTLLNVSLTISPLRDHRGEIVGASTIARDISEQKRADEAIQALNEHLTEDLASMMCLQQLSTRLIEAGGIPELLGEILDAGIQITAADMGNIQLLDDAGRLRIAAHRGFEAPFLEYFDEVHGGLAACGSALQEGRTSHCRGCLLQSCFRLHAGAGRHAGGAMRAPCSLRRL